MPKAEKHDEDEKNTPQEVSKKHGSFSYDEEDQVDVTNISTSNIQKVNASPQRELAQDSISSSNVQTLIDAHNTTAEQVLI